jgi:chaperone modulatory protein CbpM
MRLTETMVLREVRRLSSRDLQIWVEAGWVCPEMGESGPVFDEIDVARLRLLCDLRKEMALPADTVPVVLGLIDQLHETRRHLHAMIDALADQPEEVRRAMAARLRAQGLRKGE